ncbi:MAG: substrate-binding domain-containing protein, partial [Treponema sp.]|nr:substrate-binding domain-containing protein [Treponema sp.]
EKSNEIEAIFCFNDLMAAGCYDVLLEKNITPGKDISIVGFDNRMVSEYLKPSLTTMEIPLEQIGAETAKMLLEGNLQNKLIPCKLILRDSI